VAYSDMPASGAHLTKTNTIGTLDFWSARGELETKWQHSRESVRRAMHEPPAGRRYSRQQPSTARRSAEVARDVEVLAQEIAGGNT
jgi:hypothetical protein